MLLFNHLAGPESEIIWRWELNRIAKAGVDALATAVNDFCAICRALHSVKTWLRAAAPA